MDSILIPPGPLRERYVRGQKYHLLLSHELDEPAETFYRGESSRGSTLILDNSAHEKGEGEDLSVLLKQASAIGSTEIVIPDVLFDSNLTLYRARTSLTALARLCDSKELRHQIPRLMLVPQGRSKDALKDCLWEMVSFVTSLRVKSVHAASWKFTLGISKDYNDFWGDKDFLLPFIRDTVLPASRVLSAEIHLLGWPKPFWVLENISREFPWNLRSTDSARPFTFAMSGIDLAKTGLDVEYPKRPVNFFNRGISPDQSSILASNIWVYRRLCRGLS